MTGCYPRRVNMHVNAANGSVLRPLDPKGLNPDEITIAEVLKEAAYATGIFGKWHLGDQPPFCPLARDWTVFLAFPIVTT